VVGDSVWPFLTDDGLLWTGNNNSYLVKSKRNGGIQFSRDPLNLTNKNSRKV
jgi:large subunit ribosomal protein L28e